MPAWTYTPGAPARITLARAEQISSLFTGISTGFALTYTKTEVDAKTWGASSINDNAVTYAKIQQVSSMKALGNVGGTTGNVAEVPILNDGTMAANSATSLATQASIKAYADSVAATSTGVANTKLPLAGGTMTGAIAMGGYSITGAANPTNPQDVTTKFYVDARSFSTALPAQTGNAGKFVTTDGTNASWSGVNKFSVISTNTAVVAGGIYLITAGSAVTITLPAAPATNDAIYFIDYTGVNHTLARNGLTIMSQASDVTLNRPGLDFQTFYDGTTWRLV